MFDYLSDRRSADVPGSDNGKLHSEAIEQLMSGTASREPVRDSHSAMAGHAFGVGVGAFALGVALKYAGTRTVWPMACLGLMSEVVSLPSFLKDSKRVGSWLSDEFRKL